MITEQKVNKIIENACNYYLLAVKQEIEFIKNKILSFHFCKSDARRTIAT